MAAGTLVAAWALGEDSLWGQDLARQPAAPARRAGGEGGPGREREKAVGARV